MEPGQQPTPAPDSADQAIAHYAWRDLLRRAPGLPQVLLVEVAQRTAEMVPRNGDILAETEWHIEKILAIARAAVNQERVKRGMFPILYYVLTDTCVTHLWTNEDGRVVDCETPTPAAVCECGRYLVELVAPQQIP